MLNINFDLFPCHFSIAPADVVTDVNELASQSSVDGVHYVATTRVLIADDERGRVVVVAADMPTGASIIFQERLVEYFPADNRQGTFRGVTLTGKVFAFSKDTNCGCGSRLKSWNPYRTLRSIKDVY